MNLSEWILLMFVIFGFGNLSLLTLPHIVAMCVRSAVLSYRETTMVVDEVLRQRLLTQWEEIKRSQDGNQA